MNDYKPITYKAQDREWFESQFSQADGVQLADASDRIIYANIEEARVASMEHESEFWRCQCAEKSNEIVRLRDENQRLRDHNGQYQFESRLWLVAVMGLGAIVVMMTIFWWNAWRQL